MVPMLACAAALLATQSLAASSPPKPHILHVIVDDFGWANTNYHRAEPSPEVVTPRMDALVKEGVLLMRHYVHPECTPTRVSFQTGRIPMLSGQAGLCSPGDASCGAPYDMGTIAEKMVEGGMQVRAWACVWRFLRAVPLYRFVPPAPLRGPPLCARAGALCG